MKASELILNSDGSIYHLAIRPEDVAPIVIFVGDQNRVPKVSQYFDRVEIKKQQREFNTHTGWLNDKRITVMSTGIGTDNIDIALNELDALVNIDFESRTINETIRSLQIFRIGTSGSVHPEIHPGATVVSRYAIGTDALGQYYGKHEKLHDLLPSWTYLTKSGDFDLSKFPASYLDGITLTCPGFYAPQGRTLRIAPHFIVSFEELHKIRIHEVPVTNIEMETSGIYLLSSLMKHQALSFNAILADRIGGAFIKDHESVVDKLIRDVLKWISLSDLA